MRDRGSPAVTRDGIHRARYGACNVGVVMRDPEPGHELARRRTAPRALSSISGWLLFATLFMPMFPGCDFGCHKREVPPIYPFQLPPIYWPYLVGLAIGIGALARAPRALGTAAMWVRVLTWAVAALWCLMAGMMISDGESPGVLFGLTALATIIALVSTRRGPGGELALATAIIIAGVSCVPCFAMIAFDGASLWGTHMSFAASIGVLFGGVIWRGSIPPPPTPY
jgi:hypothetical protein